MLFFFQRPLIVDKSDPGRFAHILVDNMKLVDIEQQAGTKSSKDAPIYVLNSVIDLVFDKATLGKSCGLGYRKKKDKKKNEETSPNEQEKKPLDSIRVGAIKGKFKIHKDDLITQTKTTSTFYELCIEGFHTKSKQVLSDLGALILLSLHILDALEKFWR